MKYKYNSDRREREKKVKESNIKWIKTLES